MAIRTLKNGRFQVYWNNPITHRRESVCVDTEHEAKKRDALVKFRILYDRDSFVTQQEEEERKTSTVEDVFKAYIADRVHTRKSLKRAYDNLKVFLYEYGGTAIEEITAEDLQAVLVIERSRGVKNATVNGHMKTLRTILRWAFKKGMTNSVPDMPELETTVYERVIPPTPAEISAMLAVASDRMRRVIILGSQTGMRVGPCEMFRLKWSDVDFDRMVIRVPAAKKNLREPYREVPIRSELADVFRSWKRADEGVSEYVIHRNGKQIVSVHTGWVHTLKKAGITRRIRPYDLRHAFATELIAGGADIGTVASLMGHANPTMVLTHYQHVLSSQKKRAVEALPHVQFDMCISETKQ